MKHARRKTPNFNENNNQEIENICRERFLKRFLNLTQITEKEECHS